MRYYDSHGWTSLIFRFHGTFWEATWLAVLMVSFCSGVLFFSEARLHVVVGEPGHTIFWSTMSYILVFRSNNAFKRYWFGRGCLTRLFLALRELVMTTCVCMRGGAASDEWRISRMPAHERERLEDGNDIRASTARVNVVRWAIAFIVSLKVHTRLCNLLSNNSMEISSDEKLAIDWERIFLRGLLTRAEFEMVNDSVPIPDEEHVTRGAKTITPELLQTIFGDRDDRSYKLEMITGMRLPSAIMFKLRTELMCHWGEPWGIRERFAQEILDACEEIEMMYGAVTNTITTPTPFVYVNMCKVLLSCFFLSAPVHMNPDLGWVANIVLPTAVAIGLLGIDAIAGELENPFGDDSNDLDFDALGRLESECLTILDLCGDRRAVNAFKFYDVPEHLQNSNGSSPSKLFCLCTQFVEKPGSTPHVNHKPRDSKSKGFDRSEDCFSSDDDVSRPLLAGDQTASDEFVPMKEFGTETVVLEDTDKRSSGESRGFDCVGLSDGEGDSDENETNSATVKAKRSRDAHMSSSVGGFRPMPELGSQTCYLEEQQLGEAGGLDVVGLSEDEGLVDVDAGAVEGVCSSSNISFKPMPEAGSYTVYLEPQAHGEDCGQDVVGLDNDEDDGGTQSGLRNAQASKGQGPPAGGGAFAPMPNFGSQTIALEEVGRSGFLDAVDCVGLEEDEQFAESGVFKPMGDFGSQTVHLEEYGKASQDVADVIGLE
eukprot:TRINITY_DN75401_c0_g1_i1.p1 TRINITY_DN75401_c0_g1~~TRINITY_DN75401_c0_g1_i1.p1  ORF type:complete len:713 (+),score=112.50 TRINITY_DN75401_c0_g1_i1:145-2283(+)